MCCLSGGNGGRLPAPIHSVNRPTGVHYGGGDVGFVYSRIKNELKVSRPTSLKEAVKFTTRLEVKNKASTELRSGPSIFGPREASNTQNRSNNQPFTNDQNTNTTLTNLTSPRFPFTTKMDTAKTNTLKTNQPWIGGR